MSKSYKRKKDYDIVLIFSAFQRNCHFASIIKHLGKKYKIGIYPVYSIINQVQRAYKENIRFLNLCSSLGATIIKEFPITTTIEIISQSNFNENDINEINTKISSEKTFWLIGVAMGNSSFNNLHGKKIDKVLIPDLKFYNHRILNYKDDGVVFQSSKLVEIGMPYLLYPFCKMNIEIDYIIANPTPFSFKNKSDRLEYIENVYELVLKLKDTNKIFYKPHTADQRTDYIVNNKILKIVSSRLFSRINHIIFSVLKSFIYKFKNKLVKGLLYDVLIAIKYKELQENVTYLEKASEYHYLNLEIFLPLVKRGIITGRSNSIWHALFLKKEVYNCVDIDKKYLHENKFHMKAMKYLDVHGNYKHLSFDKTKFDIIQNSTRKADLISFLDKKLS